MRHLNEKPSILLPLLGALMTLGLAAGLISFSDELSSKERQAQLIVLSLEKQGIQEQHRLP